MKYFFLVSLTGVMPLLSGCSIVGTSEQQIDAWSVFVSEDQRTFEVSYPNELAYEVRHSDGSFVFLSSQDSTLNDRPGDYFITIEKFVSPACVNIGVSKPEIISVDPLLLRGRVDAIPWDHDPPPVPNCMIGDPSAGSPYTASYMLCSEKDGKQVAICVMQVTDDPELANSIFDTFRWLK